MALILIASTTLIPGEDVVGPTCYSIICGYAGGRDAILNLLLFIPFGFGLRLASVRRGSAAAIAAMTTALIETAQLFLVPGRDASVGDLVLNLAGGVIGWQLCHVARAWLSPSSAAARRLFVTGALAWLAIAGGTAWALQIQLPRTIWFGLWAPELRSFEHFRGAVLEAAVGTVALPAAQLPKREPYRVSLLAGAPVTAVVRAGPRPTNVAPIIAAFDHEQTEIFVLGRVRDDLVFRLRRRSRQARVGDVTGRLPGAFAGIAEDDTVRIGARATAASMSLWLEHGGRREERDIWLDTTLGWSLLHPYYVSLGPSMHALSAMWVAGLLLPLGYWGALARRRIRSELGVAATLVAVLALGLFGVGTVAGMSAPPTDVAMVGLGGAAVGWAVGRVVARRTRGVTPASALARPAA